MTCIATSDANARLLSPFVASIRRMSLIHSQHTWLYPYTSLIILLSHPTSLASFCRATSIALAFAKHPVAFNKALHAHYISYSNLACLHTIKMNSLKLSRVVKLVLHIKRS